MRRPLLIYFSERLVAIGVEIPCFRIESGCSLTGVLRCHGRLPEPQAEAVTTTAPAARKKNHPPAMRPGYDSALANPSACPVYMRNPPALDATMNENSTSQKRHPHGMRGFPSAG